MRLKNGRELKHVSYWSIDVDGRVCCSECGGSCDDVLLTDAEREEVADEMESRWYEWAIQGTPDS